MKTMVCYDGSSTAATALSLSADFAKAFNSSLVIVTSLFGGPDTSAEEIKHAEQTLEKAKATHTGSGLTLETHLLVRGIPPGEDLVSFAKEEKVDQIIIGIKRKSKVGKLIFGSTAQQIILEAHCPVVTVK
jgi:nucleotide-binding universal stress UspA family protein